MTATSPHETSQPAPQITKEVLESFSDMGKKRLYPWLKLKSEFEDALPFMKFLGIIKSEISRVKTQNRKLEFTDPASEEIRVKDLRDKITDAK